MFITTANVLIYNSSSSSRDSLEVINFAGYTHDEKFKIAKEFLIEKANEGSWIK